MSHRPTIEELGTAALVKSFPLFLSCLEDLSGRRLEFPEHFNTWAELMQAEQRLVLRAPRGHGKSTVMLAFALWHCWRHGRSPSGEIAPGNPGTYEILLISATRDQAAELMLRLRDLLIANKALFAHLLPDAKGGVASRTRWSRTSVRLRNDAAIKVGSFEASIRGPHPKLLLLDDVLNDANSLSLEQRDKTHRFFMGTLMPMKTTQIIVVGTAIHQDDLLARLGKGMGQSPDPLHTALGFRAQTFRAFDEMTGTTLWPEHFPPARLLPLRDADPLSFSCEFQNDPRDDAASMFPYEITQRAIEAGAGLTLGTAFPREPGEVVVLGVDVARSGSAGADYTVIMVVAWNGATRTRRILDIRRVKGLELDAQVELICDLKVRHQVTMGIVENNGFQQFLVDALQRRPEIGERIVGSKTGRNKADVREGVPRLAFEMRSGTWIVPSGDAHSLRLARIFQAELSAFGYKNGRLTGVGEHDDTVIAAWLVEVAICLIEQIQIDNAEEPLVYMEDLGIERVHIGDWEQDDDWRWVDPRRYEDSEDW